MRRIVAAHGFALLSIGLTTVIAACSGSDSSSGTNADAGPEASTIDAGAVDAPRSDAAPDAALGREGGVDSATAPPDASADAIADAAPVASLALTLDPTIDIDGDDVKVTSIASVDVLDTTGTRVATATVSGAGAVVSLLGVAAGDYFLVVNGDADDLVPTRIDDPTKNVEQRVGAKLRASMIGPINAPVYRINTYSAGQGQSPVLGFSNGASLVPAEQPYVFVTFSPPKIEFKVLGTAAPISSFTPSFTVHVSNNVPFDAWLINTNGQEHHGDTFKNDAGTIACITCHRDMATKPSTYASISIMNGGFCFRCHNGTGGSDDGFLDPTK